jgi:branched-chain amino acid transport system permease protein
VTGATGGLLAPFIGISPQMGGTFIAESFMVVIVGGANFLLGLPLAALLLGGVQFSFASFTAPFFGQLALLLMAMIIIRFRPNGIAPETSRR